MLLAGVIFSAGLTGFLGVCALFACRDERGGNATSPFAADLPCSGNGHSKAERAGGKPLDDPFSNGPHGDWPFVPADLKISRFHGERN